MLGKDEELQLFYYFLASESKPNTDPLLLWLSGGPGCSSVNAMVNEIGPLRFAEQIYNGSLPSFVLNPHAWTKIASVIFLDQPVNTGFSYATNSAAYKYTDVQACEYVDEFLRKWLNDHPQFISNPFYISGNSYSGMTVPIITQFISNGNAAWKKPLINLQSLKKNCRGEYTNVDPNNTRCANDVRTFNQMISNINEEHILRPTCGANAILQGPHKLSVKEEYFMTKSSPYTMALSVLLIGASL